MTWRLGLSLSSFFLFGVAANAAPDSNPVAITLGSPAVDGRFIQPYAIKWKLVGVASDHSVRELGVWSDSVKLAPYHGVPAIRRAQVWSHNGMDDTYINYVERRTMAPLLSQYVNSAGFYYRFEYGPGRQVKYQQSPIPGEGRKTPFDVTAPMRQGTYRLQIPSFDFNTGMFGLLVAAFRLRPGLSVRFPVTNVLKPGPTPAWIDFHVVKRERVPLGHDVVDCWLVVVNSPATGEVMRIDVALRQPYVIRFRQAWAGRDWTFVKV